MSKAKTGTTALIAAAIWMVGWALFLGMTKVIVLDEFYYLHRCWTGVQGGITELLSRFPMVGLDLIYGPAVRLCQDQTRFAPWLRIIPFLFLLVFLSAGIRWAKQRNTTGTATPIACMWIVLALSSPLTLGTMLEIRPDGAAWALIALGACFFPRLPAWILFALAATISMKAWVILACLFPMFGNKISTLFRTSEKRWGLLAGAAVAGGLALWLLLPSVQWALQHQASEEGFPVWKFLTPTLLDAPWLPVFALAGGGLIIRDRVKHPQDMIWVWIWLGAMLSFLVQKAPYPYSFIPWWGASAMLGQRVIQELCNFQSRKGARLLATVAVLAACGFGYFRMQPFILNDFQHRTFADLDRLTTAEDTVLDFSASFVFRPSGNVRSFIDNAYRTREGDALPGKIIDAVREKTPMVFIPDWRYSMLFDHGDLQTLTRTYFHPWSADLYLYGQRWQTGSEPVTRLFHVPRDDEYFFHSTVPGQCEIGGSLLRIGDRIQLPPGKHEVILHTESPGTASLLWVPASGEKWSPQTENLYFRHARFVLLLSK